MYSRSQLAKRPLARRLITKLHDSDNKIVRRERRGCDQVQIDRAWRADGLWRMVRVI
jgi:hypothetical protein